MIEFRGEIADDCIFEIEADDDSTVQGGIDLIRDARDALPTVLIDEPLPFFVGQLKDALNIHISGTHAESVNALFRGLYEDQPVELETRPWGEYWFMPRYLSIARPRYPARDGDDFEIAFDVETTQDLTDYRFRARLMRWLWRWLPGFSDLYPVLKGKRQG